MRKVQGHQEQRRSRRFQYRFCSLAYDTARSSSIPGTADVSAFGSFSGAVNGAELIPSFVVSSSLQGSSAGVAAVSGTVSNIVRLNGPQCIQHKMLTHTTRGLGALKRDDRPFSPFSSYKHNSGCRQMTPTALRSI